MTKDNETGLIVLRKQPSESRLYDMSFDGKMRDGDTISSVISSWFTNMGKVTGSTDITLGTASISGDLVQIRVEAGQDLENYKITHKITTAPSGDILEGDGLLLVREK